MSSSQHKTLVGANLRIAIHATHRSLSEWAREYDVTPHNLGNWLRGDNYPDPYIIGCYCDEYGLTMDWIYRSRIAGVASGVADSLKQQTRA